jgi:hypothetical protein
MPAAMHACTHVDTSAGSGLTAAGHDPVTSRAIRGDASGRWSLECLLPAAMHVRTVIIL